jgi:hypothetical protein
MGEKTVVLQNRICSANYHINGGALVDFRLQPAGVNPLQFVYIEKTSENTDLVFEGHFLCAGHWGDPSPGEAACGHVKHGDFHRLPWQVAQNELLANFTATSTLEGLCLQRRAELDKASAVLLVEESIKNIHAVGRLYNLVQHPTIAAPFLDADTIVDCNAAQGFDYAFAEYNEKSFSHWPEGKALDGKSINLSKPDRPYSSVFSFSVNPNDEWGWITAYSPAQQTVLGYVWKRAHYPWIAHWLHFSGEQLQYRGLEFGTTGVHKPMKELWEKGLVNLLGERTCRFIDTGETHYRSYMAFLFAAPDGFNGVERVQREDNAIVLTEKGTNKTIKISHQFKTEHVFQQ